ncbi:MAG: hypothetical protein MSC30_08840 [Gaiellaceae bacterium MAG52_C11]|nr:hypothetical protein [Candidatus Gaiellasilicea maunaloa]
MSELVFESSSYRLELATDGLTVTLSSPGGLRCASLRPLAALDTVAGPDETLEVLPPRRDGAKLTVERRSTIWERASVTLDCADDALELRASVSGRGELSDVHLLGFRSLLPRKPSGFMPSGSAFRTLFSPNPSDPRVLRPAAEACVIGVSGDGEPGRGHWLFTPAPLYLALSVDDDEWVDLGLAGPVAELGFVQLVYETRHGGFALRLEYEGHTRVDGDFEAPTLILTPGVRDPYAGLRRHRDDLVARNAAPAPTSRETPAWWREPIFCGWGAQCHLAETTHAGSAADRATQASYDAFLSHLEREGVAPGTIVLDDKWQAAYGTNEPDREKWSDLSGWIAARHARGQKVLLWWKAWDPEGLSPELCVRNPDGVPVALDPTNPRAREALRESIRAMLSTDGLDADGLKIDFTARTPSGRSLSAHGAGWGIALLHDLLTVVYAAAKEAKADALVMTHTPHPAFVDVTDMIRLNDMVSGAPSVVPQMRHRARVAQAACPELLIDTDDWRIPSLREWREYVEEKPLLGIPSLYYAHALDATSESFEPRDYEALRRTWAAWRAAT